MNSFSKLLFDYSKFAFWVVTFLCLVSCGTSGGGDRAIIEESNRSLTILHTAIESSLPGGIRKRGENNRVFYGQYHPPGGDAQVDATRRKKRAHAVVFIMNERRPYTIVVEYRVESRKGRRKYKLEKKDYNQALKVKERLEDYLASRPEKRDLIDGFRAF